MDGRQEKPAVRFTTICILIISHICVLQNHIFCNLKYTSPIRHHTLSLMDARLWAEEEPLSCRVCLITGQHVACIVKQVPADVPPVASVSQYQPFLA